MACLIHHKHSIIPHPLPFWHPHAVWLESPRSTEFLPIQQETSNFLEALSEIICYETLKRKWSTDITVLFSPSLPTPLSPKFKPERQDAPCARAEGITHKVPVYREPIFLWQMWPVTGSMNIGPCFITLHAGVNWLRAKQCQTLRGSCKHNAITDTQEEPVARHNFNPRCFQVHATRGPAADSRFSSLYNMYLGDLPIWCPLVSEQRQWHSP